MKVLNTFFILLIVVTNALSQNPFERRTLNSDVIVEGKIIEKQSFSNDDKSRIFTSNKIEITKIFKGLHTGSTVDFLTVGGIVDNDFQFETHSFQVGIGQVGIFFLQNFSIENPVSEYNLTPIQDDNFIPYRNNRLYFEAIDGATIYTNPSKEIYPQLESSIGTEYQFVKNTPYENKIEQWLNDNLTFSTVTDNLIEFSFDNIVVNGTLSVDFDVYVKSNQQGIKFAASDVFVDYSHEAFGYSVVSNNNITGEKREVIDDAVYTLVLSDEASEKIKIEVASVFQPNDLYELALFPEKFCHMALNIQDVYALATMSFDDSMMSDQSFFYDPSTGTYVPFDKIGVSNPVLPFALPQISTLSPNPITAGTGDVLTITGTNFGNHDPQTCNGCRIKFADGDQAGFGEAYAQYKDIVSWTDTEIKVKVPSATNAAGFKHPAATGGVWVERPSDLDPNIIEQSNEEDIHIKYSVLNYRGGIFSGSGIDRFAISNQTTDGILFKYHSNVPNEIKTMFKNAVSAWCTETQVAWKISDDITSQSTDIDGDDNINLVIMKPPSDFPSSTARAAVVIDGHYELCGNGLLGSLYISDIDIKISNEYNPFNSDHQYKWFNYILHELGHAHGLNHSKNPSIPTAEEYIMNSLANNWGVGVHDIQPHDTEGSNTCFTASQALLSAVPDCSSILPISTHDCGDINPIHEVPNFIFDFRVSPNPFLDKEIVIDLVSSANEEIEISVSNYLGQQVHIQQIQLFEGKNRHLIKFAEELSTGMYYVSLRKHNSIITQKLVRL